MLAVGRIAKLYGVDGTVQVNLYDTFPANINYKEQPLFVNVDNLVVPLFCDSLVRRGNSGAIVRFSDIDTPSRASMIMDHEIFVDSPDGEDDEYLTDQIIGYKVLIGDIKGEVSDFYDSEVNPLLEVEISGKRHLVPAVEDFVVSINRRSRTIKMQLPDGLLDL